MKKVGRIGKILLLVMMLVMIPVQTQAAARISVSGANKPTSIKQGAMYSIKGTVNSKYALKQVIVTIYDSKGKKCLQRFTAAPNTTSFNIAKADPYIAFNKLAAGSYYYRVKGIDVKGYGKRVISKKFKVLSNSKLWIENPKPAGDISINKGASYALGGTINSTYNIASITGWIYNSSGKIVYTKNVKPNKKKYAIANSPIDSALFFDKLPAGTYKYKLGATDAKGTSTVLVYRTVTVKGSTTAVTTQGASYTTSDPVVTPSGFAVRNARPAKDNKYFYNSSYNIYAKYNSLAPTGKAMSGGGYVTGNCTWYACGRALEIVAKAGGSIDKVKAIFGGDPVEIYNQNKKLKKFSYGTKPKVGSLVIFNYLDGTPNTDAHIAVVESIQNGIPIVSESGYTVAAKAPTASTIVFKYQSIYSWANGRQILGYIYLV